MSSFKSQVKIESRIKEFSDRLRTNIRGELFRFGEDIMDKSRDVVPVDTGTLMSTGNVRIPDETDTEISCTMGYGGPAAPYALAVHENLEDYVNWKRPGSGPKYLERPFNAMQGELPARVADAVERAAKATRR